MKTFDQLREDTSAAVKAFLAKGGKIKKLPPAKAQGYHGKDDPGKDMRGMLDRPDTKKIGTRKKVKSMGEVTMPPAKEIMKHIGDTKHAGQAREILKKKYGVSDKHADKMINHSMGQSEAMISTSGPFGINPKVGLKVMKKGKEVPPTPPKIGVVSYTGGKKDGKHAATKEDISKLPSSRLKYHATKGMQHGRYTNKEIDAEHKRRQRVEPNYNSVKPSLNNEANLDELSYDKMNKYHDAAQKSKDRATNSAVATILRKGDHSQDLKTRAKRIKGMELAKTRTLKKIRGDK